MLHSMAIRLIHVDQLVTVYVCYGLTCQSGLIAVTGVKSSLLPKMFLLLQNKYHYLLHVTKCIHVCSYLCISLRPSIALWVNYESFLPAGYADCVGNRF